MQPPVCAFCGTSFSYPGGGDLVQFADYEPLPEGEGRSGHPRGLLWFCNGHLAAAAAVEGRTSDEALELIRRRLDGGRQLD